MAPSPGDEPRRAAVELLFAPASVAIVGASTDPRKWGYMAAEQALRDRDRRRVHLVNSRGGEILGAHCLRSVGELPEAPDLAIVTVPPGGFERAVDDLLALGTRAIVAITAGFGEADEEGREIEARVAARVRAAGAVMVGPNCMGVFDGSAPFRCMPWAEIDAGPVGFISQSGGLIMDLSMRLAQVGLGLSRAVSVGNQADLRIVDLVRNLARHASTELIAIYCEAPLAGRELFAAIQETVRDGKPVAVISPDSTAAARRAARSHTASLVSDRRIVAAAAEAAGACYAGSPRELAELLQALASPSRRPGRRVAVVSDTGGPVVLAAGEVERAGLEVPPFSATLQQALSAQLTPRAVVGNPVDLVDNLNVEPAVPVLRTLIGSGEVDAVLLNLHAFVHDTPALEAEMGRRLADVARAGGLPVVITCRSLEIPGVRALLDERIPVYRDGEAAARALALLCRETTACGVQALPVVAAGTPVDCSDYLAARSLLGSYGIEFAHAEGAHDAQTVLAAAERIGYPVVLKALGAPHKSDGGGVALHLKDAADLAAAAGRMQATVGARRFSVERLVDAADARELILGLRRDREFGPVILLGFGGIYAEVLDDVAVLLAPATRAAVEAALRRLRGAPLLFGARGRPSIDLVRLYRAVEGLNRLGLEHPEIAELDVNPLLVSAAGATALDVRMVAA